MCLGVPGKVVELLPDDGVRMGIVDFAGVRKRVCLAYLPEIAVGDYCIVHVGFAITQLDEASARETLRTFQELGVLEEEFGADAPAAGEAAGTPALGGDACPNPATWQGPAT